MNNTRIIRGNASIFLDSLRIIAALIVLVFHVRDQWLPSQAHDANQPRYWAHAAVVIFFVLSGYVIAHTTSSGNRGPLQYAQARLSRLCSIVIPSLLITALIEITIGFIDPTLKVEFSRGITWPRYLLCGFFLNEIWLFSAAPPINMPLWSLSFEFWYYVIFGFFFYRKNKDFRSYFLPLTVCLLAGPKILIMMPIWLSGYMAYHLPRLTFNYISPWLIVLLAFLASITAVTFISPLPYPINGIQLKYANQFITDWIIGAFIAIGLWNLPIENQSFISTKFVNIFRRVADLTFPIYILHYPLLILCRAIFSFRINDSTQMWQVVILVLLLSAGIGLILEQQRPIWVLFFKTLLQLIRNRIFKIIPSVDY